MLQKAKNSLPYILAATIISTFLVVAVLYAWTEPGVTPPDDNAPAPLNVGTAWQIKQGGIALNAGGHQAAGLIVEQGNVGIGTTAPAQRLHVAGNALSTGFVRADGGFQIDGATVIEGNANRWWGMHGQEMFRTSDEWLRLNQAGHFAHGVHIPTRLNVNNRVDATIFYDQNNNSFFLDPSSTGLSMRVAGNIETRGGMLELRRDNADNAIRFHDPGNRWFTMGLRRSDLKFYINHGGSLGATTQGIVIQPNGNVGIGDTTPGVKLDVAGNVRANAFYYHSDQALKREIKPIENSLERVLRLEPVSFEWKEDGKYSLGLIAQDVEKVFPEIVFEKEGEKSVAYGKLVAPLIEAIREQQAQIEALRAEIEKLKTR